MRNIRLKDLLRNPKLLSLAQNEIYCNLGEWREFPFTRAMVIQEEADIFGDQNSTWKALNDIDDIHKIGKWKTA